ncbi:MAG: methyltransferase domain-containing protein [Chloroflexota bacterium]
MKANDIDVRNYNRAAWDKAVEQGSEWTIPVSSAAVEAARQGNWQIVLTPTKPVPAGWFPKLQGAKVLGLASGGGQQGPLLAAAGADVTIFDNSPQQLAQDAMVAEREELPLQTVEGDMRDLSIFADASFDLIVHPCSNLFVDDVLSVWQEAYRVLKPRGHLLAGFCNPILYLFDQQLMDGTGELTVCHSLPYSDLNSLPPEQLKQYIDDEQPLEFGHTLQDQIGGQLNAGFVLTGYYDDYWPGTPLAAYTPTFCATWATKM